MANVFEAIERAMHGAVDAACAAAANDSEGLAGGPERPGPSAYSQTARVCDRASPEVELGQGNIVSGGTGP